REVEPIAIVNSDSDIGVACFGILRIACCLVQIEELVNEKAPTIHLGVVPEGKGW
ncbi:hypothetical protein NPIL_574851, partial [Nephila pilipes]